MLFLLFLFRFFFFFFCVIIQWQQQKLLPIFVIAQVVKLCYFRQVSAEIIIHVMNTVTAWTRMSIVYIVNNINIIAICIRIRPQFKLNLMIIAIYMSIAH